MPIISVKDNKNNRWKRNAKSNKKTNKKTEQGGQKLKWNDERYVPQY